MIKESKRKAKDNKVGVTKKSRFEIVPCTVKRSLAKIV